MFAVYPEENNSSGLLNSLFFGFLTIK